MFLFSFHQISTIANVNCTKEKAVLSPDEMDLLKATLRNGNGLFKGRNVPKEEDAISYLEH